MNSFSFKIFKTGLLFFFLFFVSNLQSQVQDVVWVDVVGCSVSGNSLTKKKW